MSAKKVTKYFILSAIIIIAFYDVYAFQMGGTDATISWVIFEYSHEYPVTAFVAGFICGHLFWQMKGLKKIEGDNEQT